MDDWSGWRMEMDQHLARMAAIRRADHRIEVTMKLATPFWCGASLTSAIVWALTLDHRFIWLSIPFGVAVGLTLTCGVFVALFMFNLLLLRIELWRYRTRRKMEM